MSKLETLEQIRARFANKQNTPDQSQTSSDENKQPEVVCPKCGHSLTVESTNFFIVHICENCFEHTRVNDRKDCCHNPDYHLVKLITSGGTLQAKEQCKNCGNVKGPALGGFTKEQKEALPMLNEGLRELRQSLISDQYRQIHRRANEGRTKLYNEKREQRRDNWLQEYSKYLNSPEWRNKRELVLKRDNYRCQACLENYATQVHHKSYEFVDLAGSEPCYDLIAICAPCHERIETMKAEKRKSNNNA
jgi:5-methylcytosine-specific restriction endonuclease McrA